MTTTRRHILRLTGRGFAGTALASAGLLPRALGEPPGFEVDRLLAASAGERAGVYSRRYTASATITLFSIPIVSKGGVGSGYAVIEEGAGTTSIQFGAGSYPESARGLNRLGFIQEAIVESAEGEPAECAWLAFMTTSQEKNLEQAKQALESSGAMVPYSASQGYGHGGRFVSRVDRLEFPSKYRWRDAEALVSKARAEMAAINAVRKVIVARGSAATFLYCVRRAMIDARPHVSNELVFNSKQFRLDSVKERDAAMGAHFAAKQIAGSADRVMRINATITELATGEKTPFRLWYECGDEHMPPLRFEYQARSFLRLSFEAEGNVKESL